MAKVTVKMNDSGVRAILTGPGVQADLLRRANAIKTAAGGDPDFTAGVEISGLRARAHVLTATPRGKRAEAEERALTRAVDAGR